MFNLKVQTAETVELNLVKSKKIMMNELKSEIERNSNLQMTENGATGFSTTCNELVDLNFKVPSFRKGVPMEDLMRFDLAMRNNLMLSSGYSLSVMSVRVSVRREPSSSSSPAFGSSTRTRRRM